MLMKIFFRNPLNLFFLILLGCSPSVPTLLPKADMTQEKMASRSDIQVATPAVDVLFVVDNSYSMENHQRNLSQNIDRFVNAFTARSDIDYHIGVLTTDMSGSWSRQCCGHLVGTPKFVDRKTLNGASILASKLRVGTGGDSVEKSFDPVYAALSSPLVDSFNVGFYRENAHLAVIFITDAEDQSNISPADFYSFLVNLKGSKDKILGYGVVVPSGYPDPRCTRDSYESPQRIEDFLEMLPNAGSNMFALCDVDYGDKVSKMGDDLVKYIGNTILLSRPPVVSSIKVFFGTQEILPGLHNGWTFDVKRNAIVLGDQIVWSNQPDGTQVQIIFDVAEY
jgi:hypothetical protein